MAFVLAGGRGSRLKELTDTRAKPAVFFGGQARIIDFVLSNAINSGIGRIAIATQYKAYSLIKHCQQGRGLFRSERNEYLDILPASQRLGNEWYQGTADAMLQNVDIIDSYDADWVVVLAGDHIYKMDYSLMLREHVDSGADVTIGATFVSRHEANRFGVLTVSESGKVTKLDEKPKDPIGTKQDEAICVSMGIYIFRWKQLRELLLQDATDVKSHRDLTKNIVEPLVRSGGAQVHRFADSCVRTLDVAPYWRDVGALDVYWASNLNLTEDDPELDLWDESWPISTHVNATLPAKITHAEGDRRGTATNSLIAGGCIIQGSDVTASLLFTGVRTGAYAMINKGVILPDARIGRTARLSNVIVDRGVVIPEGLVVGEDPSEDAKWFRITGNGVALITQSMVDARAANS